jgi:endonuclease IV
MDITIISESPALERDALLMKEFFEKRGVKF